MLTRSLLLLLLVSNTFAAPLTPNGSGTETKAAPEEARATDGVIESHHEEAGSHNPLTSEDMLQSTDLEESSDGDDGNDLVSLLKEIDAFCTAIEQSNMHKGYGMHMEWMELYNTLCLVDEADEEAGNSHRQKRSAPAKRAVRESDMVASAKSDRHKRELFLPEGLLGRMKQHTGGRAHHQSLGHHSSNAEYGRESRPSLQELLSSLPEDDEDEEELSDVPLELTNDDMGTLMNIIQQEADKLDLDVEMITHQGRIGFFFPLGDAPEAMNDEEDDDNNVVDEFDNRISPMAFNKRSSRTSEAHYRWSTDDKKRIALKRQELKRRSLLRLAEYLAREHQTGDADSDA